MQLLFTVCICRASFKVIGLPKMEERVTRVFVNPVLSIAAPNMHSIQVLTS